ncbi:MULTISPECIES: carboxymuconolactone decarboxylase family protein [unclassified Corallococcus]|uniref:carboxymuconolactone decarboxylase family protein n=1 Tax=unclassified Corallococcus TaxID=2685029 RepID=UPI001A8F676B|nr:MULTISPECIES: carboxymuconolactone decarboxylase family protein [unclassified Corallococcus]MBN9685688.1 carboxymuconolactone decarboxylase family protein [Corallococcus sp. NCSPR001]WAS82867.1 carboxymuconolactone decarboxylase family protein [Corallococcus sp. NCRR]
MGRLRIHTIESAPEQSRPVLAAVEKSAGFRSNLLGLIAESPGMTQAFAQMGPLLAQSSLGPVEREVVIMTIGWENDCSYCMAFHSFLCRKLQVPDALVTALRSGTTLPDPRLEVLAEFTRTVVREKGTVGDELWSRFTAQGFTSANALDVILALSQQVLVNYANHLGGVELEPALKEFAWTRPAGAAARTA